MYVYMYVTRFSFWPTTVIMSHSTREWFAMIQPNSVQETILNFVKITNLKIWA